MKHRICKLCGADCGKHRICPEHKVKYPFVASNSGQAPFNRAVLMGLESKREVKKRGLDFTPEEIFNEVLNDN